MVEERRHSKAAAWAVHAFSASGAVLALLAVLAIDGHRWTEAMLWLFAALVVDGVDGTLARAARVKEARRTRRRRRARPRHRLSQLRLRPDPVHSRSRTAAGRGSLAAGRLHPAVVALRLRPPRHEDRGQLLPRLPRAVEHRRALSLRGGGGSEHRRADRGRARSPHLRADPLRSSLQGSGLWVLASRLRAALVILDPRFADRSRLRPHAVSCSRFRPSALSSSSGSASGARPEDPRLKAPAAPRPSAPAHRPRSGRGSPKPGSAAGKHRAGSRCARPARSRRAIVRPRRFPG